jgi:anti-anti-sigma factor
MRPAGRREGGGAVPIRPTLIRAHRLLVTGELGHDSAAALEAEIDVLCASGIDRLVLDLGGLRAIDATGIRVIAMRCALCDERGTRVELERVGGALRAAFAAAGLAGRMSSDRNDAAGPGQRS